MIKSQAVIGLCMGDEGKGITTDYLCSISENPLVTRFSGGHQAGHTVVYNGIRHVFSNFGSGTLRGVPTFWSKYCTVEPIGLFNEYDILLAKGIIPMLYISINSPVTTPYDILENRRNDNLTDNGTCGVGVGTTLAREEAHYSLTFSDLFYPSVLAMKLGNIKKFYSNVDLNLDRFYEAVNRLQDCAFIIPVDEVPACGQMIFEGSQGLLLDENIGFFPHVTRGFTGTKNIKEYRPELFLVTRAYQTRHGYGPMTNEKYPHNIKSDPLETNVRNEYQGKFRRSLLDLDLLQYGMNKDKYIRKCNNKSLVITCLDHVEGDYRFTSKGIIHHCLNQNQFIERIWTILGIDTIYISETNESKNIFKWEG